MKQIFKGIKTKVFKLNYKLDFDNKYGWERLLEKYFESFKAGRHYAIEYLHHCSKGDQRIISEEKIFTCFVLGKDALPNDINVPPFICGDLFRG